MSVLITGGAGYIGSHCISVLKDLNIQAVTIDSLENGHRASIDYGGLYVGDLCDKSFLRSVFDRERIDSVIHFASYSLVGESMRSPAKYFNNNVSAALSLLDTMLEFGVKNIVFSSSAAVYGEPSRIPIDEEHPLVPTNPYGESKKIVESLLKWYGDIYGIRYASLRYFNVAGAHENGHIGEDHHPETHLIPNVLRTSFGGELKLFGTDYPTFDGTCVRDYIHVMDLVDAHFLALDYLKANSPSGVFNLGNGRGFSNREVIDAARRVTGSKIPVIEEARRPGDPAVLVASSEKARETLGWRPKYDDIEEIIRTAWKWHYTHPAGYADKF